MLRFLPVILFLIMSNNANGQYCTYPKSNPVELGKVNWGRNYEKALTDALRLNLPVLILFQEVPGCSNCTTFGKEILSHPLLVEAIETCFVPLCIYNNVGGADHQVLEKYGEPTWNNPVIRIVDYNGKDIVSRQPDFRYKEKTLVTITEALRKRNVEIPGYLALLMEEWSAKADEAYLSMYCFWTGEKEIAKIPGVIGTEAGYMHGNEVVKVIFDKHKTDLDKISNLAKKVGCADQIYGDVTQGKIDKITSLYRIDKEDKYYLSRSKYKVIPMTTLQKTSVNSALGLGHNPEKYLSPKQIAILNNPKFVSTDRRIDQLEKIWW
jgi:Peptide methionine sulfoxide reductase